MTGSIIGKRRERYFYDEDRDRRLTIKKACVSRPLYVGTSNRWQQGVINKILVCIKGT
jgi:hypothetical protein